MLRNVRLQIHASDDSKGDQTAGHRYDALVVRPIDEHLGVNNCRKKLQRKNTVQQFVDIRPGKFSLKIG